MTGKELWKCGDDLASYSSPRPIEIDGKKLVLVFAREGLMGIDPELGKVMWRFDHRARILESVNAMMPVVVDDHVLISECYEVGSALLRVSEDSCQMLWKDPPGNRRSDWARQSFRAHWATPIVIDGYLYGCNGRNPPDSDFRCIDFQTGEVKWIDPRRIRSSVTRVGDHLVVLEERGRLQVVEPSPQELKVVAEWDLAVPDGDRPAISYPCWAAPIVVGDRLILRGTSQVLCLKLAS
jgi:outer membrane protein assembly factor BamB